MKRPHSIDIASVLEDNATCLNYFLHDIFHISRYKPNKRCHQHHHEPEAGGGGGVGAVAEHSVQIGASLLRVVAACKI